MKTLDGEQQLAEQAAEIDSLTDRNAELVEALELIYSRADTAVKTGLQFSAYDTREYVKKALENNPK